MRISDWSSDVCSSDLIRIEGAQPHPTKLVQSTAMASVAPPQPSYRPHLPTHIIKSGVLSDAQLESVIYAGEAHSRHLAGSWTLDDTFDNIHAAAADVENAVRFRRGCVLGDGTGCGTGRPVAGIILEDRKSCREVVGQYVSISGAAGSF